MTNQHPINGAQINGATGGAFSGPDAVDAALESAVITATSSNTTYDPLFETASIRGYAPVWDEEVDTAKLGDSFTSTITGDQDVADTAVLNDSTSDLVTKTDAVAETAVLNDTLDDSLPPTDVAETAVLDDSYIETLTAVTSVSDTAILNDSAPSGLIDDVAETAVLNDSVTPFNTLISTVEETAVLDDTLSELHTLINAANETAVLNDTLTAAGQFINDVAVTGYFTDQLLTADGLSQVCWTANVINWAMSRHADDGITARTSRYAVSPAGLYTVSAAFEDSNITTGHVMMDTSIKKRAPHLYVVGEYAGTMSVTVTGEVRGTRSSYTYTAKTDTTTEPTVARADIGRGFHSPYYQFTLVPVGESALFHCDLPAYATRRRV